VKRVTTHEAKTHLSRLIARVRAGEEVVIYRGDQPTARLVGVDAGQQGPPQRRAVGTITSAPVVLSSDAFAPLTLEELAEWGL
jgi:prevent-host-death family protein